MINSVDSDQMSCSGAFDLGLHCSQSPICPNTYKELLDLNPFMLSGLFYHNSLDRSISSYQVSG